jgi:hypothetical protein
MNKLSIKKLFIVLFLAIFIFIFSFIIVKAVSDSFDFGDFQCGRQGPSKDCGTRNDTIGSRYDKVSLNIDIRGHRYGSLSYIISNACLLKDNVGQCGWFICYANECGKQYRGELRPFDQKYSTTITISGAGNYSVSRSAKVRDAEVRVGVNGSAFLPSPTADIKCNGADSCTINNDTSATISWTSSNTDSCSVSPNSWGGTSGSRSTGNLSDSQTYTLNCDGPGGSTSDSVSVTVNPPVCNPNPTKRTCNEVNGDTWVFQHYVSCNGENIENCSTQDKICDPGDGTNAFCRFIGGEESPPPPPPPSPSPTSTSTPTPTPTLTKTPKPTSTQTPTPIPGLHTIRGGVYQDLNTSTCCDGVWDTNELGLGNHTVTLTRQSDGSFVADTKTGADGMFQFNNIPDGDYRITHVVSEGWERTTDDSVQFSLP